MNAIRLINLLHQTGQVGQGVCGTVGVGREVILR